jgi:hypothetical protein
MYQLTKSKHDILKAFSRPSKKSHKGIMSPLLQMEKIRRPEPEPEPVKEEEPEYIEEEQPVKEEEEQPVKEEEPKYIEEEQPVKEEEPEDKVEEKEPEYIVEEIKEEDEKEEPVKEEEPEYIVEEVEEVKEEDEPIKEEIKEEEPLVEEEQTEEPDYFQQDEEAETEEGTETEDVSEELFQDIVTLYDYDGESYFVDNDPFLQKSFDIPEGSYKMNLCIYTCVRNGPMPFLLFLTVYDRDKNTLILPRAQDIEITLEDTDEDVETIFMETFQQQLFDIYPPNELKDAEIEEEPTDVYHPKLFKGFYIQKEKDTKTTVMVYDATRIRVPLATDKEYFWVTPYEIMVLFQFRNVVIDTSVTYLFEDIATSSEIVDKSFYTLKRLSDNSLVPSPYVLFSCSKSTPGFFNFFGSSTEFENRIQEKTETVNLITPTIDHPQLGRFPFFSALPLNPDIPHIQRYAVFVDIDGLEPTIIPEDDDYTLDHLYDEINTKQYSSISFMYKDKQYWCIKSPFYFTEIYDNIETFIPISTFSEISSQELHKNDKKQEHLNETLSNEGSYEASDDEVSDYNGSNEGSDNEGSNEGTDNEGSDEEEDKDSENEDYRRGYEAGIKEAMEHPHNE